MPLSNYQLRQFLDDPVWMAIVRRLDMKLKEIDAVLDDDDNVLTLVRQAGARKAYKYVRGLPESMLANIESLAENRKETQGHE